ncbi:MAG TPA: nuclear transport factor 2 family protein [Pyrinomonadaceae bacterium]
MKSVASLGIIALTVLFSGCARRASTVAETETPEQVRQELVQLERRLIVAVQRKDMDTLNEIWAPEYFGTAPTGRTVTKADLMSAVKGGAIQLDTLDTDGLYVRLFGDVAVMTGHAQVKSIVSGEDLSNSYRGTGIFVKRNGRWQIAGVHVGPDQPTSSMMPSRK